ncbi:hypothetical protein E3Q16_00047 [Wallemia mellicola]|nr:hypothetical protein E3Q16_00047 [Wallemia mellicola]
MSVADALQINPEPPPATEPIDEGLDAHSFKLYLQDLLPKLLNADTSDLITLWNENTEEDILRFANDQSLMGLYIQQLRTDDDPPRFTYNLTHTLTHPPNLVSTVFMLKRFPTLSPVDPLSSQLVILNLADGGYEVLHALVHLAAAPYFDAFVNAKGKGGDINKSKDSDAKLGIPMTKKKFAELELSLLHLQQNVEIPETHLVIHSAVRDAVTMAHNAGTRPAPSDVQPQSLLNDSTFLNRLQNDVNSWIKEIRNVTKLNRDVASGTASQEINFWLSMERALESIEEQLKSEPIMLTLEILKYAKRFHATVSFIADTGLKEATDVVHKYNQLMKDFPLDELLSATDFDKVQDSLYLIFGHINKKLKLSPYPIRRALPLVEAISKDFNDQMLRILQSHRLMYMEYESFERSINAADSAFRVWDDVLKEFTNVAREVTRKRSEKFLPIKINAAHWKLAERCNYLRNFRKQHEQLRTMTAMKNTKAGSGVVADNLTDLDMEDEVKAAYDTLKNVNVLDISVEGTEIWIAAETAYNERVARVENQIIARLRDRLGTARNASEMFRVFGYYNALFVRPKIRGAISEYQTQLIDSVKEDIKRLHGKFTTQYKNTEAFHMSQLRDIPPIAGAIIWAKQIERQLNMYMKRVEDVLGEGWDLYAEGAKLQSESTSFRKKLDTKPIFDAWLHEINRRDMRIEGRLFEINRTRNSLTGELNVYQLGVNFDPQVITLFKEVRNLIWRQFQVPHAIVNIAKDAKRVYPHAVSLMETVRTYSLTVERILANRGIETLIAEYRIEAQNIITRGMPLRWEFFVNTYDTRFGALSSIEGREGRHMYFIREFASSVSILQDKTDDLIDTYNDVMRIIDELSSCPFNNEIFTSHLTTIQKTIDKLNLEGYANLDSWVAALDSKIENVLLERVKQIIDEWCIAFNRSREEAPVSRSKEAIRKKVKHEHEHFVELEQLYHEIRIRDQVIYVDPPIEHSRTEWYKQLHVWLGVICNLPRIQSSRYEIGLQFDKVSESSHDNTYTTLLTKLPFETLSKPFALIEDKVKDVGEYVGKWLQFQSLWDLEGEQVYSRLGDSLALWQQLLSEIKRTRSTFDTSDTQHTFGAAIVDFAQVQVKVNAKYDFWQRDIVTRFGQKLKDAMKDTHSAIQKARYELETQSIEGSSTVQAVSFITFVQDIKKKAKKWDPEIAIFVESEKTLDKQRYQFPSDWMWVDQVQGEWSAFNEILKRKNDLILEQLSGLQLKIDAEDKIVRNKIEEITKEWEDNKPIQGNIRADQAMNTINIYGSRVEQLKSQYDLVFRAKEALDLEHMNDDRLEPVLEELKDLRAVWTALSGVWDQIAEIKETTWASLQPRKLRSSLEGLLNSTNEMPSRMRQYSAFEFVQDTLRSYLKLNSTISDLRSEALHDRHWNQLFKSLKINRVYSPNNMTLENIYDIDLKRNESLIRDVITQAAGEMALEEFLKQVRETWSSYQLELVNYQNKCYLIRGWDDLFSKCTEHTNSLTAMSNSPYFKVFEDDARSWEDKLNRVHNLFNLWIDVQRQWVYLEGIFSGSADIKHLLPMESQKFQTINTEFYNILKGVKRSPYVLEVLGITDVQKRMEKLAETLNKVQKALGEYLERERSSFPRFYFVGDEDLLEIIGNSKDILRIMKHLKKMFAGISNVILDEDITEIQAMVSKEGEVVKFSNAIQLKDYPKINDWLAKIESEMRTSLADLLTEAVESLREFYSNEDKLDVDIFLNWMNRFPAQLVVLAIQVEYSTIVDKDLQSGSDLKSPQKIILRTLDVLADTVLTNLPTIQRRKCEHLITELVHQRDVLRSLIRDEVKSHRDFNWLYQMRFYLDTSVSNSIDRLNVHMADATFDYGYEYLGVPDRLVQTPLTDRCYLTLTQALNSQLGGAPFGPAGTGKTESVKALGVQLGRFVLVFCCDETFDFQAMGRIFIGLCQVGAWGCFDEFNRLDEGTLSAVSEQILQVQQALATSFGK